MTSTVSTNRAFNRSRLVQRCRWAEGGDSWQRLRTGGQIGVSSPARQSRASISAVYLDPVPRLARNHHRSDSGTFEAELRQMSV